MKRALQDWSYRLLVYGLIALVGLTTRKVWVNRHVLETLQRQSQNAILAVWHNNLLYFLYILRGRGAAALISRSRDGENIAWVARRFGFDEVRGSDSAGAAASLRGALRRLAAGRDAAITPDGPRGPRYEVKPGIVSLAQRTGVPIVPLCFAAARRWEFGSWDRMKVPKPFSRVVLFAGDPIRLARETDPEAARRLVERALRRNALHAERFAGTDLPDREPLLAELERAGE